MGSFWRMAPRSTCRRISRPSLPAPSGSVTRSQCRDIARPPYPSSWPPRSRTRTSAKPWSTMDRHLRAFGRHRTPPGMPAPGAQQASIQGKVQRPLYRPAGDVKGALLEDGTIVRIGPREAYRVASLLNPGQILAVQGWALTTAHGSVIDAQAVGPSPNQLTQVAPPPPPGLAYTPPAAPWPAPPPR